MPAPGNSDSPSDSPPRPDAPAHAVDPGADADGNPPESIFKHGPHNAGVSLSDADLEALFERQIAMNRAIDQGMLPKSHLLTHDTKDRFHKYCTTCRAGLQRRKAARADSTDLEVRQVPKAPFGACIRLDTEDCHLEAVDEHWQYFDGQRYDLIMVDSGTGWNFSTPVGDKRTSTVKQAMRLARTVDEKYKIIASDSAGEFCKAARQLDMDFVPSVPYRSTTNPI